MPIRNQWVAGKVFVHLAEEESVGFAIIGILVVIGAVLGGFLMEHGPVRVLIQPAEMIIILALPLELCWRQTLCTP